jgi:hypothetical protein
MAQRRDDVIGRGDILHLGLASYQGVALLGLTNLHAESMEVAHQCRAASGCCLVPLVKPSTAHP